MLVDHLLKVKKEFENFKEAGDTKYIYRNELDKACFQHDMAYGDFEDLARRTVFDNVLKHLILLKLQNMMYIKEVLHLWFIIFLIKSLLDLQINLLKVVVLLCYKVRNELKNYTNQSLKRF